MLKKIISSLASFAALGVIALISIWFATVSAQTSEEKAVREVLTKNTTAAFEQNDLAMLDKIWANDESVIVIENGYANYGWTNYPNNHLAPEMKEIQNTKYALSDVKLNDSSLLEVQSRLVSLV